MADWSTPTLSTTYTAFLSSLKSRDDDVAVQFSPSFSTASNTPTGTIRWNPTNNYWEIKNAGGSFVPLTAKFMIDVDKLDGQDGSYYLDWANLTGVPSTFTPSAHTHDDRYYTETESNARFSGKLIVSGNTIKLQTPGSVDLSTITVPYATTAGDATTVGGFSVGQNLLKTSGVVFASAEFGVVNTNNLSLGDSGTTIPEIEFWDETGGVYRGLKWNSTISEWQVEDSSSISRRLFHEGHYPDWTEIAGKPTSFTPSTHGHAFTATEKAVLYSLSAAPAGVYTGSSGEITYNSTAKRLVVHDGVTVGGLEIASLGANSFTAGQSAPTLRATSTTAITLSSTGHAFQTGFGTSMNMAIDTNKIQVRENGAATAMFINPLGGDVTMGNAASLIATLGNFTCFGEASVSGPVTGLSQIFAAGSVTTPAFSFASDPDTGMYRVTTNALGFAAGGTEALRLNSVGAIGVAGGNYGTTGQVLTSNGSGAAPTWTTPTLSLGVSQTWQDVKSSRTIGTAYQNTTGRSIEISITMQGNYAGVQVSNDNTTWNYIGVGAENANDRNTISATIPVNGYYKVTGGVVSYWLELR